jgi:hypothetical protein
MEENQDTDHWPASWNEVDFGRFFAACNENDTNRIGQSQINLPD